RALLSGIYPTGTPGWTGIPLPAGKITLYCSIKIFSQKKHIGKWLILNNSKQFNHEKTPLYHCCHPVAAGRWRAGTSAGGQVVRVGQKWISVFPPRGKRESC